MVPITTYHYNTIPVFVLKNRVPAKKPAAAPLLLPLDEPSPVTSSTAAQKHNKQKKMTPHL